MQGCGFIRNFASVQWNEGLQSSSFSFNIIVMIDKNVVKDLVEQWLEGKDYFLVDVAISVDNKIVVEIDHADGVWIEDCAELSRYLQEKLGDELGDYELEVGSAGIGQPFKVEQQYVNHVGDEVEVLQNDGQKIKGVLKSIDGRSFTVTVQQKQTVEGKKRPVMVNVDKVYSMDGVKSVKYLLSFK